MRLPTRLSLRPAILRTVARAGLARTGPASAGLAIVGATVIGLAFVGLATPVRAEALRTAAVGCRSADDAARLAAPARDKAQARALVASGACIDFAKGITIDVDERRPPLLCVRLTGDLSCYWMAAALVDDHPSEKGGGAKRQGGGKRH